MTSLHGPEKLISRHNDLDHMGHMDHMDHVDHREQLPTDDRRRYDGSRHTAGAILDEPGVDMPTITEILRHTPAAHGRRLHPPLRNHN